MPTTPGGLPYPLGTDPVANGAQDIQDLAEAVDPGLGLWLVKTVTIGTTVASVPVTDAFSADFNNYKIVVIGGVGSTTSSLRLTLGTTSTGYYWSGFFVTYASTTVLGQRAANSNNFYAGAMSTSNLNANIELRSPNLAKTTSFSENSALHLTTGDGGANTGYLNDTTQYTSFTIAAASGTMTGGTIRVYGYRN
jgi:hypothetical protein